MRFARHWEIGVWTKFNELKQILDRFGLHLPWSFRYYTNNIKSANMFKKINLFSIVIAITLLNSSTVVAAPEVRRGDDGFYSSKVGPITYFVDTVAQLCFVGRITSSSAGHGVTLDTISCNNLNQRPEWRSIITWVN
ncbi:MAG: hypothetical protein F6K47_36205 [Symploca sp. SIO2E6]|nr:hypothetical protein [Symploca sp. SIO2E6]